MPEKLSLPVRVRVAAPAAAFVTKEPVAVPKFRMVSLKPFRSNVPETELTSYLTCSAAKRRTVAPDEMELMKPFWLAEALFSSSRPPVTVQSVLSGVRTVPVKITWPPLEVSNW